MCKSQLHDMIETGDCGMDFINWTAMDLLDTNISNKFQRFMQRHTFCIATALQRLDIDADSFVDEYKKAYKKWLEIMSEN